MRTSQFPLNTVKETPTDAEIASHRLLLRAHYFLAEVLRRTGDRAGALELLMPTVQPAELWQESGRWDQYGPELLRFKDRHQREFAYGPTHEEIITDLARNELRSYKQLPVTYYQIQTKFRHHARA